MLENYSSLNHSKWECKYHVVFIPKYRRKKIYKDMRIYLGEVFRDLAQMKESQILEGHLARDHVHMLISIPPKYAVCSVIGFMKGKSAIRIAREYMGKKNLRDENFWARGYLVTTVGQDEASIREYIEHQEKHDRRTDQLKLKMY
ncbi:MAG: IS200/IS605 family transposase [SAR324 cluster bacterium]|uniref:IS200/IS605 family transposase n=1 Tax=SAR324 cluster bacterium TaxID=2024889 RepID=A0A7X9FT18_9DELT|nr:IS200/IS605 family transposase [SAR324 cluster bacterium]